MIKVVILGAAGRMGQALLAASSAAPGVEVHAAVVRPGHPLVGRPAHPSTEVLAVDDLDAALVGADVLIDFTTPALTLASLSAAERAGVAVVVGTTGLDAGQRAELESWGQRLPLVFAPNMSVGVNVMMGLVRMAAQALEGFDVEVFEIHHRGKADAPSGTALRLAEVLCDALGRAPEDTLVHGRHGVAPRTPDEIGLQVARGGTVAGEHTVFFFGQDERVEITHRASDRGIFAQGAVRAARWVAGRAPGLYTMADVLGLPPAR